MVTRILKLAVISFVVSFSFNCASNNFNSKEETIEGFWTLAELEPNEEKEIFFEIKRNKNGELCGNSHIFWKKKKNHTDTLLAISFKNDTLQMISHPEENQKYIGIFDKNTGNIIGKLVNEGGNNLTYNLKRIDESAIKGLRPKPQSYRFEYVIPENLQDGIEIFTAKQTDLDLKKMDTLVSKICERKLGDVHSVLIAKNNKLVFEEYFFDYSVDDLHAINSCTKSITSLLIGITMEQGKINSVNDNIWEFFSEYEHLKNENNAKITLKQLLTMTAGFKCENAEWNDEKDLFENALSREVIHQPGKVFQYDGGCSEMLAKVIRQSTGLHADAFAEEHLFKPLGIKNATWEAYNNGYPITSGALHLTSRDMLKIGLLIQNEGTWNGRQIVSKPWIKESTEMHIKELNGGNEAYGYQWWIEHEGTNNNTQPIVFAQGVGFQIILVIPESDMVIVVTAGNYVGMEKNFLLWKEIHKLIR